MKSRLLIISVAVGFALATNAVADNRVRIDSVNVSDFAIGSAVPVGVFFENDVSIQAFLLPLIVRSTGGGMSFSAVDTLPWTNRLAGNALSFSRGLTEGDTVASDQFLVFGFRSLDPPLSAGADGSGSPSLTLELTLTGGCGSLEIDTALFPPNGPLLFISDPTPSEISPEFVKGAITCVACNCPQHGDIAEDDGVINVLDVVAEIDHVFRSGPPLPPQVSECPAETRGEVTCDGIANVLDVVRMIDYVFRLGVGPCDPCACSNYPDDCP